MNYRVFNVWFAIGQFKAYGIKTLGDLQKYINGEWDYEKRAI